MKLNNPHQELPVQQTTNKPNWDNLTHVSTVRAFKNFQVWNDINEIQSPHQKRKLWLSVFVFKPPPSSQHCLCNIDTGCARFICCVQMCKYTKEKE